MSGLKPFYANGMLRSAAIAMVGIFTPVFVYRLGTTHFEEIKYGIMSVAAYYFITRLVTLLVNIPASHLIEKIGFRKSILVSIFLLIGNLAALILSENNFWLIVVSAIASGLTIS